MTTPTAKLVLTTIVGTILYFALAVLGWGGIAPFFAHPARIALTVFFVLLAAAALFTDGNLSPGEREDRGNRWVIPAFGILGLIVAYVAPLTDRLDVWTIDGDTTRWIGVAVFAIGGLLRLWPVFVLGNRFSGLVAIQPGHTLVTTGIYSVIRHPSYVGLIVNALGWALAFRSSIGVLLTLLMFIPLVARMNAEEALLRSQFGSEYESYMARTSRLIPGVY
jgi:protein-S-isoprenylcysteine O-methyltransferase Ste14